MPKNGSTIAVFVAAYGLSIFAAALHGRFNALPDAMMDAYSLGPGGFGWLVSLTNLAPLLLAGVAGYWIWGFGLKKALIFGACLQAAISVATTLSVSPVWAYVLRGLEGVPYLIVVVAAPTLIAIKSSGTFQTRLLAFWGTYFFVGVSAVTVTSAWGLDMIGWKNTFLLVAAGAVVLAGCAGLGFNEAKPESSSEASGRVSLSANIWLLCFGFFGVALMAVSLPSIVPLFLSDRMGFSQTEAGTVVGIAVFVSAGGSILYGLIGTRVSARSLSVCVALVAAFASAGLFSLGPDSHLAAQALCLLCFLALGSLAAVAIAAIPRLASDTRSISVANGMLTQAGSAGALLGPPAYLFLFQSLGWQVVMLLVVFVSISTALLLHTALNESDTSDRSAKCRS